MRSLLTTPPTHLVQPLPRRVRPVRKETLTSYLHRLARVNHLNSEELRRYLTQSSRRDAVAELDRLARLSGQALPTLQRTIYEYGWLSQDQYPTQYQGPVDRERTACERCVASREAPSMVVLRLGHHECVCQRHRRWLATTRRSGTLDLSGHPEVLRANWLHRRLVRLSGSVLAAAAFEDAERICVAWHQQRSHEDLTQHLMSKFHVGIWEVPATAPTLEAARYPQAVALARLLASPYWREQAFQPDGLPRFVNEVRRTVAPRFWWNPARAYGHYEPLVGYIMAERSARLREEPPDTAVFLTEDRPAGAALCTAYAHMANEGAAGFRD